jgi:hypothetical protein
VVYPARYDECIAVAGVNQACKIWKGSCRGSAVDVSAPAELVYRARRTPDSQATDVVGHGQGTSFAVAITAGIAALWLKKHGPDNVRHIAATRNTSVQYLFLAALQSSAAPGPGWDAGELGAGIVDAVALLGVDLKTVPLRTTIHAEGLGPPLRADLYGLVVEAVGNGSTSGVPIEARFEQEIATLALDRVKAQANGELIPERVTPSTQELKAEAARKDTNGPVARLVGAH